MKEISRYSQLGCRAMDKLSEVLETSKQKHARRMLEEREFPSVYHPIDPQILKPTTFWQKVKRVFKAII